MKKHPNSPHLSIKRLRELAEKYTALMDGTELQKKTYYFGLIQFINYVDRNRSSLTSKHVKK